MLSKVRSLGEKAARTARRIAAGPVIMLYHRVSSSENDPQWLSVTPEQFESHLEVYKRLCHPMPLREVVEKIRRGTLPRRAVVLTFDDGYADNLEFALPLLEQHGIPATVFAATDMLGSQEEYWWDQLEALFLQDGALPERLELTVVNRDYTWEIAPGEDVSGHSSWNITSGAWPTSRHRVYQELTELLIGSVPAERQRILDAIWQWSGKKPQPRASHLPMNQDQLRQMAAGGVVEIGSHGRTHTALSLLSANEQRDEIFESKRILEETLDRPVLEFSYPYGRRVDYTSDCVRMVEGAGYESACSNYPGSLSRDESLYEMPRNLVRNWDASELAHHLRTWLGGEA